MNRAWIEINSDNLKFNLEQIKSKIPITTEIMAVIKANAYGHGDVLIAKKLNKLGINNFAVATLEEAINLRKNKITGEILILGYINPQYVDKVVEKNLTLTLIDENYCKQIEKENTTNSPLKVHIKVNTGMNRIGFSYRDTDTIEKVFNISNIKVTGMFSHLAVSDEQNSDSIKFTQKQMNNFENCVQLLKSKNYDVGKVHIQNSYGIFAESHFRYDFVRTGLFLYGITEKKDFELKPVLSLKSRITSFNTIEKGDYVGYGRGYAAKKQEKIATISIGYADGYPRALSNGVGKVLINGEYAKIIGKICMDQLMVNITNINNVNCGDIVTLIGHDNNNCINVNELADSCNTISYEILSRLGQRLARFII